MPEERILSADSHVVEPADVWTARIEKRYADRAPRIINEVGDRKGDFFVAEGLTPFPVAAFAVAGVDPKEYKEKMAYGYWGVRPGAWDPVERIKDQERDGVMGEMERAAKRGLKGAMIWGEAPAERPYGDRSYDRFWAAAQNLGMPVSLHILTERKSTGVDRSTGVMTYYPSLHHGVQKSIAG